MVMSSAYGTSPYDNSSSVGIDAGTVTVSSVPIKKKRGRPKKCAPDGTMPPPPLPAATYSGGAFSSSWPSFKKVRGRPPGSGKKHQTEALGSVGLGFTPHIITVKAGEDVSSKIMAFSQNGSRAVCILSANGAISDVILRQAAISGGCVTYEGRFEILSLSGSYLLSENGSQRSRTGGLSVSLAGPDGCVLGGSVAGLLTAASPVQVIVGSFISGSGHKEMNAANQVEPVSGNGTPNFLAPGRGALGGSSPPSHGTLSESSGGPGSPFKQSPELYNNGGRQQGLSGMPWK